MADEARLQAMLDELEVRRARCEWAFARDLGEYDRMRTYFHDDATVAVSWFDGPFLEFWERTKALRGNLKPTERSKHWIGNQRVELNGDRAVMETDVLLFARDDIEGVLFDYTAWMRFHDRAERREGVWRIAKWVAIYDRDRFDPVIPGSVPASFFAGVDFSGGRDAVAFMKLRQAKLGRKMPPGLVIGGSDAEARLKAEGAAWLAQGARRKAS
jgi:SnoaL-like domain